MKLVRSLIVAASLVSVAGVATAGDAKTPNCQVKGKKSPVHVADEAACKAKKGTWIVADATTAAPAPASAPADAAHTAPAHTAPATK